MHSGDSAGGRHIMSGGLARAACLMIATRHRPWHSSAVMRSQTRAHLTGASKDMMEGSTRTLSLANVRVTKAERMRRLRG